MYQKQSFYIFNEHLISEFTVHNSYLQLDQNVFENPSEPLSPSDVRKKNDFDPDQYELVKRRPLPDEYEVVKKRQEKSFAASISSPRARGDNPMRVYPIYPSEANIF